MKYRVDLKSLKTEIERKGFQSVEELSEKSRINERELTLVLDGKNLPAMDVMVELASALELTPEKANEIFFNRIIRNTYKRKTFRGREEGFLKGHGAWQTGDTKPMAV
ncbi:MAG: XRE family transcriptional regulator [Eisenbergiella massiliensis]